MKNLLSVLLIICLLVPGTVSFAEESNGVKGTATRYWEDEPITHDDFVDLGDYIIDLGIVTPEDYEKGLAMMNTRIDTISAPACTAIVKRNSEGEVIIGRNMDLEVSNYAAYIAHFVGGRYQVVSFTYNNKGEYTYADLQQMNGMPEGYREMLAACAFDVFNEAGLYMQMNMRTGTGHTSTGTNPGGKRVCVSTLGPIVAQNCATVAEALAFIESELDVFSAGATKDGAARAGWDGGYLIGDATGEYGIIEFANNQMYYTPYANGHANYYVHPNLAKYNNNNSGFGRMATAQQSMIGAETAVDMMEAVHRADWAREITDIQYSYRDEQGIVHFEDKDGNPSIDYRSEFTEIFAVSDDGQYIPELSESAFTMVGKSESDMYSYMESTMAGIFSILTEEEQQALSECGENLPEIVADIILHYRNNCTIEWLTDDNHFEMVKQATIDYFESQNAFELLDQFYAGDEQGIRNQGDVFTTGLNIGVNCSDKHLVIRFMEHANCVYEYQW